MMNMFFVLPPNLTIILSAYRPKTSQTFQFFAQPEKMDRSLCGLALVKRQASSFPKAFHGFQAHHCARVTDVPVGQIVFCLPFIASDVDWRAVILSIIIGDIEYARLTWIHPECLEPLGPKKRHDAICVDLTVGRGNGGPSIQIDEDSRTGVKEVEGDLVLDARWPMRFGRVSRDCTGHCFAMCRSVLTEPSCFASILRFAAALRVRTKGRVCCHHGKHRSVAAANILMLLFEVDADFSLASKDRTRHCCDHRAGDDIIGMLSALRELPEISGDVSRPLAFILGLPEHP